MELYNDKISEMSSTTIRVKMKEIGTEYQYLKDELVRICDKMELLQEKYNEGVNELKKRNLG